VAEPPVPETPLEAAEFELSPEAELEPEVEALALEEELILEEPAPEPGPEQWPVESASWPEPEPVPELASEPEPAAAAEPEPEWQREEEPAWSMAEPEPDSERDFESSRVHVNGGSGHKSPDYESPMSAKTLEDSVKEMLRPMLRQWLDENLPRVLDAALREELHNPERRGN
jgi:cell pole-organizing protein PopZ